MDAHKKTILFWALVLGIFFIIFLMWVPQFVQSIKTLSSAITTKSNLTSSFQNEWNERIEETKKNFDTLLKETEKVTNTPDANGKKQPPPPASPPPLVQETVPSTAHDQEAVQTTISMSDYCAKNGGKIQNRKNKSGTPYEVCIFSDGSECEATMFQKGSCKVGQTNVAEDLLK